MPIRNVRPVTDYLELQGRFAHLMEKTIRGRWKNANICRRSPIYNIAVYGLRGEGIDPVDTQGIAYVKRGGLLAGRA
jgi:pyruvate ferredoxin oxidoreductase beta subunit